MWGLLCGGVSWKVWLFDALSLCFSLNLNALGSRLRRTKGCWILRTIGLVGECMFCSMCFGKELCWGDDNVIEIIE